MKSESPVVCPHGLLRMLWKWPVVSFLFALGWRLSMSSTLSAQEKPLAVESSTMQPSVLPGRPMLTWWDVKIPGSGLVVGQFQFLVKSDGQLLSTVTTEELTLNGPEQRIRVMLPAIDTPQLIDQLQVDIVFHGKKLTTNLGQQILRVPFSSRMVYIGLVGESRIVRKRSAQRDKVLERLRFETMLPKTTNSRGEDDEREYVKTIFASVDPADLPSEPLAYCGYDLVVLMADEFRTLRKPQLEALLAWIKAGGSLYLEPHGVLEPFHLDFLRQLVANDVRNFLFQTDAAGRLPPETVAADQAAVVVKCALGRAVIRTDDSDHDIEITPEALLAIVGPLWKSRFQMIGRQYFEQPVIGADGRPTITKIANPDPWGLSMALFNRYRLAPGELFDRLMPDGVRMVPLSLLAVILFVFVCMIGPGDYFVLGWLRLRKLTWLTFPVATLAVTGLTVWLSNSYMSAAETRRAVVIRDLGENGDIVRTNRFELLFVASTHNVATEVDKGLFTPLESSAAPAGSIVFAGSGQRFVVQNGLVIGSAVPGLGVDGPLRPVSTQFEGRIPARFIANQDLAKWTPQLNRVFSIPGSATRPECDWSKFNLPTSDLQAIRGHQIPAKLANATREQFGAQAMVACFSGEDGWAYDRSPGWRSNRSPIEEPAMRVNANTLMMLNGNVPPIFAQIAGEADLFRWIYAGSVAVANQGMFSLTSQTSPKGGASCDDLPVLDLTDPNSWLLVVVVPEKDDFIVYRKLMRFDASLP